MFSRSWEYFLKRLIIAPIVLFALITIAFFQIRCAPGDPFNAADKSWSPEVRLAMQKASNLDKPLPVQYLLFLKNLSQGDLGQSLAQPDKSIKSIILERLPASILIGTIALSIALFFGIVLGVQSGINNNGYFDYVSMLTAVVGISIPAFVAGPIFQLIFATKLGWLPLAGYEGFTGIKHLILPAITLSLPFIARIARLTRSGMIDVLSQDYIRTARAKGIKERKVIIKHAIRGALLPLLGYLGPATATILTGSLVIEKIFHIPGLGSEFIHSAMNRDYPLVIGTVIVYGTFLIVANLVTEIAYGIVDPRIRGQVNESF